MKGLLVTLFFALLVALPASDAQAQVVFEDFNDGDISDVFTFSETGGGIGVGTTDDRNGTADAALSIGVNPGDTGSFSGFVVSGGAGTTDVTGMTHMSFYLRPQTVQAANVPVVLEINFHEDINGDGVYDGGLEDEYQAIYQVTTGEGYTFVQIPVASFTDDNAVFPGASDGFDYANLFEIVVAYAGVQGPEFALSIDDIVFSSGAPVDPSTSSEDPEAVLPGAVALSPAYPNPFTTQAQFDVTLQQTQPVRVEVFDMLGRSVQVLYDGVMMAGTPHRLTLDGQNLASGMYLYRVTTETFTTTRSIILAQ